MVSILSFLPELILPNDYGRVAPAIAIMYGDNDLIDWLIWVGYIVQELNGLSSNCMFCTFDSWTIFMKTVIIST